MSSIQDKIDTFRLNCYEMATNDANELSASINEEINKNISDEIELYKKESNSRFEKKSSKLEQDYNCQIFEEENRARHAIIDAENAIKEDLKTTIINEMKVFVNSEKYQEFLMKNIKEAINELKIENGDTFEIKITIDDFNKYKNKIEEKFNCNIETTSNKNIGGSICVNKSKNISINNTLKILIEENLINEG